jgi:hypothetical protein
VSILFRTKKGLTIAELVPAWAAELPGADRDPAQIERHLGHSLLEDIINGRLDEAGPEMDGRRLGLRLILPDSPPGCIEGQQVRALIAVRNDPAGRSFVFNWVVVLKEAVLDFARRHELPSPLWWADTSGTTKEQTADVHLAAPQAANAAHPNRALKQDAAAEASDLRRRRGRKPEKLQQVKEAMKTDLRRGRYTKAQLQELTEKVLAATYGVSRDTARKARSAVVSEIAENSIRDK